MTDFGKKVGPLFWNYHLTAGVVWIKDVLNRDLRFYGLAAGEWGIGIFRRTPATPEGDEDGD